MTLVAAKGYVTSLVIESISGHAKLTDINMGIGKSFMSHLVLNGTSGYGGNPGTNNYSALNNINIVDGGEASHNTTGGIFINSPIILGANITAGQNCYSQINIHNDVTLTRELKTHNHNMTVNIIAGRSLTLDKDRAIQEPSGGTYIFNINQNSSLNINGNNIRLSGPINFNGAGAALNINGSGTFILGKQANSSYKDPIINLRLNQLNLDDNVTFYNNSNMTLITKHQGDSGGHIVVTGGNLDLSKLDSLIITPIVN